MQQPIAGIHHVTVIASDPHRNLDFFTKVLGLRLVEIALARHLLSGLIAP